MKIFVIDDQAANIEAAKAAILEAGHEVGDTTTDLRFADNAVRLARKLTKGDSRQVCDDAADWLFDEIRLAVTRAKEQKGGVITDLMFYNTGRRDPAMPPAGLLVVIEAITAGVPVVICTNAGEVGGHHAEAISWIFDGYVWMFGRSPYKDTPCPFGWVEDKNWSEAIKLLVERQAKIGAG